MYRSSLRTWLLLVSVFFALLVIGGVALATYVVVSDGMSVVAHDAAVGLARSASELAKVASTEASLESAAEGLSGEERDREAERRFLRRIPDLFRSGRLAEGEYAFYGADLREPFWFSAEEAVIAAPESREEAVRHGRVVESSVAGGGLLAGFVGPARLGVYVIHVPIDIPGGGRAVIDVSYFPDREEAVIDSIRVPMAVLAGSAMLIMVLMMQTSMGWVLRLVNELRQAADSVDADQLDVRLPEHGEHEISDLARSINRLIDRLQRRADIQTRFVADASHELATPVAGIRGYTNILRAWGGEDPEVRDEAIAAIDRESRRMARLCGDLLSLVRTDTVSAVNRVRFDANAVAREVLAASATRYQGKDLEIDGPGPGQLMVVGDPDRLEDVLSVLVDNACKYTPPGGRVSLDTRVAREWAVFEVRDTGIGIPEADLPVIFERFYRSDESRSKETGGFGLGLAIAKASIEAMGGEIGVQSAPGFGSLFVVRVPRA